MKKIGGKIAVVLAVIALLGVYYYVALPAVNIHATEFWIFLVILVVLAALIYVRKKKLNRYEMKESKGLKAILTVLVVIVAVYLLGSLLSSDSERKEISKAYESGDRRVYKGYRGTFF